MIMQLDRYLYHYGLKAGVPFGTLQATSAAFDVASQLPDYLARKRVAGELVKGASRVGFVPKSAGFRRFTIDDIPSLQKIVEVGQAIYKRHHDVVEKERAETGKSPITHLFGYATEDEIAECVDVATGPEIAEIMCDYFESVPRFDNADLWISRPNANPVGSQLFHLDKPDRRYTSIFVNIEPVDESNGPLQLLDKVESDRVRRATAYEKLYYLEHGRLRDEDIDNLVSPSQIHSITGPSGGGGIVDTSACFHSGSRCQSGERVVMILSYMHAYKPGVFRFRDYSARYKDEEIRQLMLDG